MTSIAERRKQFLAKKRRKAADNDDDQEKLIAITENYSVYTKSGQMVKHFHKESLKALQKEMEILRSLEHKNIVKFYATDDSAFKIVMERYEKGSLQKLVHEPMYTYTMTTLTIGDFGSAFYYNKGENSTITSELDKNIGSPSPAVSPNEITHKSDIYSAGIVLWELCERRRPFQFVDNVFNALLEELDVKNEKLKKLTASCANHVPEKRPSASEALEVLQEIENVYDKFSFLPEFKQDETQLIRPIGFDAFLKSFLLLASCTMLEILPPLIQRMNACLEKLAELLEIFEWPAYLKVFLNVNTGEEWYYFGETPCENIPFHQHILMRKSDWKVKVLFGVWEGKTTLVIENKYHIKQQKLQLMGCEWITHEWIVDQIRTLQLKRDTLIGLLLKDERDTHAFEANGSMIWRTDDAGAVDMVLMLAFITAPKETLLSYYGCSKENLASYEGGELVER
ncbi:unnamed protein product, partial [Mesorhabditis belari]|uniref:Protein kinase domain-containing protein n=1 Tax=Mesorhabditis belari TaxID=2138241 RepID=A0AAF3EXG0_9BILA